ncbi:MAG: Virus attachment protein p12 family protein [Eubacteriales bacterium]|jgi:hypothetical protein
MQIADYILITIIALLFLLAVRYSIKHRHSCCGDCSKCSCCQACKRKEKK